MSIPATAYHIGVNGSSSGPFPEAEIRTRLARGELSGADLCWTDGWPAWKPLAQVFPDAGSVAAPPPPPPAAHSPSASAPPFPIGISGNALVVPRDIEFPRICIRTGATEDLIAVKRQLSWHHPAVYLGILANILIYLVLALILRKKSTHLVYLSRQARSAQIKWHLANWGLFLGIWVSLGLAAGYNSGFFGLLAFACAVATIAIYFLKVRILYATRIDETDAHIGGIPRDVQIRLIEAWR